MSRFFIVCSIAVVIVLSISGCEKEDPNPELMDPIWQDISKRAESYNKTVEEHTKKLEELKTKLEKAEPNTMDLKDVQKEIAKTVAALKGAKQLSRYYKIRADRRKVDDKIAARAAKAAGKEWPDKAEYSDYLVNMRVREISLNWGSRVPKLKDRLVRKPAKAESAPKAH